MQMKPAVAVVAAGMAGSVFLTWVDLPGIASYTPFDLLEPFVEAMLNTDDISRLLMENTPIEIWLLAACFLLPALFALLAIVGWAPRLLGFACLLLPLVTFFIANARTSSALADAGIPRLDISFDNLPRLYENLEPFIAFGLYVYVGCWVAMLALCVIAPNTAD